MNKTVTQIPGEISGFRSMRNGAWRITFDTQENIPPELMSYFPSLQNKLGWMTFTPSEETIDMKDIKGLPDLKKDGKSPSQRLRNVLFRLHEHEGGNKEDFDQFYIKKMESMINYAKEKLNH